MFLAFHHEKPDKIEALLGEWIPNGCVVSSSLMEDWNNNREMFIQNLSKEYDFTPMGELNHKFSRGTKNYEVYLV